MRGRDAFLSAPIEQFRNLFEHVIHVHDLEDRIEFHGKERIGDLFRRLDDGA